MNRYDAAARKFRSRPAADLPWGTKLEYPGVMDLIEVEDVVERFEAFASERSGRAPGSAAREASAVPGRNQPAGSAPE